MKKYVGEVLKRTRLLGVAFRVYEFLKRIDPRILWRNRRYLNAAAPDGITIPPVKLIVLVAGNADIAGFLHGGELAVQGIRGTLERNGIDVAQLDAILDFGCGCGRVIRHWHTLADPRVYGSDYNPRLIDWCRQHLDFAQFDTNQLAPPLKYENETFGLVYTLSVFTHLPESLQGAWIDEISRVLKPGGYLLMSTHGERYLDILTGIEREDFEAGRLVVRDREVAGTNLCSAFHPPEYVREQLGRDLDFVDFVPEGARGNLYQDIYLFRKPVAR